MSAAGELEARREDLAASERRVKVLSLRLELAMLKHIELQQAVAHLEVAADLERRRPSLPIASGWIRPRR